MVVIAESVWEVWREREAEFKKPSIALLLDANVPPEGAVKAMGEAVHEAMTPRLALADSARPGEDEFRVGYVSFARVPEGVLLQVDEGADDFEGLLHAIADGLRARGIDGELDLFEADRAPEIPELVDLFECHLRLVGEPETYGNYGRTRWRAQADALESVTVAAIDWCRGNDLRAPLSLAVGLLPPFLLGTEDDVRAYVREGLAQAGDISVVRLTSAAPGRFRILAIDPGDGRIALIEGGRAAKNDWPSSVRHLKDAMRDFAPWAVYGFVKRGSRLTDAVHGSLPTDWLDIPHMNALIRERQAVEDRFVPDAFGIQLLSQGHQDRLALGSDWRVEPLASGRLLVEHKDPAAWFDGSLVRFGGHPNPYYWPFPPTPPFLARARVEFDPLLYRDGRPPAWAEELGDRRFQS